MKHYPIYKSVRVPLPFCNICKEMLTRSENSIYPWSCSCGKWEYSVAYGTFKVTGKKELTQEQINKLQQDINNQTNV